MEILDLHLGVEGYASLDADVRAALMERSSFGPLANSLKARLAQQVQPGATWLAAEVQGAAVFVAEDWVVSIHGSKLMHYVSAMCLVVNTIREELNAPVSILLLNPITDSNASLHSLLAQEGRQTLKMSVLKWVSAVLISGFIGAVICELVGGLW